MDNNGMRIEFSFESEAIYSADELAKLRSILAEEAKEFDSDVIPSSIKFEGFTADQHKEKVTKEFNEFLKKADVEFEIGLRIEHPDLEEDVEIGCTAASNEG